MCSGMCAAGAAVDNKRRERQMQRRLFLAEDDVMVGVGVGAGESVEQDGKVTVDGSGHCC